MLCLITNNECGTDTWQTGSPCRCNNCQLFIHMYRSLPHKQNAFQSAIDFYTSYKPYHPDFEGDLDKYLAWNLRELFLDLKIAPVGKLEKPFDLESNA